ncbi:hypothetical protein KA183_08310 [bacterium]|nr:hypothetical protein [bacterium]
MTQSPFAEKLNDNFNFELADFEGSAALALPSNFVAQDIDSSAKCRLRKFYKSKSPENYTLVSEDFYTKVAELTADSWLSTEIPLESHFVEFDVTVRFPKKRIFSKLINIDPDQLATKPPRIILSDSDFD